MSIALIRGPQAVTSDRIAAIVASGPASASADEAWATASIPREVTSQLVERACMAGKTIAVRSCGSESELLECLRRAGEDRYEFVMFDPGVCACNDDRMRSALGELRVPYIEVHDDHFGALEPVLSSGCGPRLRLVQATARRATRRHCRSHSSTSAARSARTSSMSASDRARMDRYSYFADYEIPVGERLKVWAQTTLVYRVDNRERFDPADLVDRIRQQAADEHGAARADVRSRALHRLA